LRQTFGKIVKKDIFKALVYLTIAIITATIGFSRLENRSLAESFYWAIVTLTTVGYGDITPVTFAGRIFSLIIMFLGIGTLAIFAGMFATYLIDLKATNYKRRLRKMKNIVLLCGYNEKIKNFLKEIDAESKDIVCIAPLPKRPDDLDESIIFISGHPYEDQTLIKAKIFDTTEAIVSLDSDQDVILTALSIQALNKKTVTICNVLKEENTKHLYRIGVDKVVCDETMGGQMFASLYRDEASFEILKRA